MTAACVCRSATAFAPFKPNFLTHGRSSAAHPPSCPLARSLPILPSTPSHHGWTDESIDSHVADSMRLSAAPLCDVQDLTNRRRAVHGTSSTMRRSRGWMYGGEKKNLERLRVIRGRGDHRGMSWHARRVGWKF